MKTEDIKVAGLDISKASATCHSLENYPSGGLGNYWRDSSRKMFENYPTFYSFPKGKSKNAWDFVEWLKTNEIKICLMEPTGVYSRLWAKILEGEEIEIKFIGHLQLKRYRQGKNLPGHGKNDAVDSLALASYYFDPEFRLSDGSLNPKNFLRNRTELIGEIRERVLQLEHLNRLKSPAINYLRQRLSWEFPEKALTAVSGGVRTAYLPGLIGWLAERDQEISKHVITRYGKAWDTSIAKNYGIDISSFTRFEANILCEIEVHERIVEAEIKELLSLPDFADYIKVFDALRLGPRTKATILSQIFPFETFLLDGKEYRGHERREVRQKEKSFTEGKKQVKFQSGEEKRVRRNYSRDAFKMMLGCGTIYESSGDGWQEVNSGSSLCRKALWRHIITIVETDNMPDSHKWLTEYKDKLKSNVNDHGKQLMNGNLVQSKLIGALANKIYRLLIEEFRQ